MTCDLCRNDEALAGQLLCPVCQEAILRLATAVKATAEIKPTRVNPLPVVNRGPAHFKAAAGVGIGKTLSVPPSQPPLYKPKADRWSEESLPDFTD